MFAFRINEYLWLRKSIRRLPQTLRQINLESNRIFPKILEILSKSCLMVISMILIHLSSTKVFYHTMMFASGVIRPLLYTQTDLGRSKPIWRLQQTLNHINVESNSFISKESLRLRKSTRRLLQTLRQINLVNNGISAKILEIFSESCFIVISKTLPHMSTISFICHPLKSTSILCSPVDSLDLSD